MEKASIPVRPSTEFSDTLAAPLASEIDELAERSEGLEQRIASLNDSYETLKKREVELIEWRWVLKEAGGFFDRVSSPPMSLASHPIMGWIVRYSRGYLGLVANYFSAGS